MKRLTALLFAAAIATHTIPTLSAADTLPPLENNQAPKDLQSIWRGFDPRAEPLETEILKQWEEDGVILKVIRYRIGTFKGKKAMMAAVYGHPKDAKKLPGLVQIHGGGQYADHRAVLTNAKRGYTTISISWAGRISAPDYTVRPDTVKLFWDNKTDDPNYKITTDWGALDAYHAPSRNGKDAFTQIPVYDWSLDPVKSPRNNSWFLCTLGARRALSFLEQQPQVDATKLGVYGHSMGGKLTVLTAAVDKRVKAAAPSCGGISDHSKPDPLYRNTVGDHPNLERISCPTIFLSPANDFHGRIKDLIPATAKLGNNDWRVTCSAHINHKDMPQNEVATQLWFDQHLKGTFTWPATPASTLTLKTPTGTPRFALKPDTSMPIKAVDVFYTQQGTADNGGNVMESSINRFWHHATATNQDGTWSADLPLSTTDKPLWVYANVLYALKQPITGAGYYYGTYTTDAFNLSSLLKIANPDQLKAAGNQATLKPARLIESFQGDWQKEWFTTKPKEWARKTHKLYHPLWATPQGAKLAIDICTAKANKLAIGIDSHAAEATLAGGPDWQTVTLSPADFRDADGAPLKSWQGLKELRLSGSENLKSKATKQTRLIGAGHWQGAPPQFRNLRWITTTP